MPCSRLLVIRLVSYLIPFHVGWPLSCSSKKVAGGDSSDICSFPCCKRNVGSYTHSFPPIYLWLQLDLNNFVATGCHENGVWCDDQESAPAKSPDVHLAKKWKGFEVSPFRIILPTFRQLIKNNLWSFAEQNTSDVCNHSQGHESEMNEKPKDLEDLLFESLQKSEASEPCTYTFRLFFFEVFVFVENIILRAPHISCHIVSCLFFGTVLLLIHHFSLKRFEWGCLELKRDTCTVERKRCAHDPIKTSEDVCSWLSKSSLKLTKLHNHLPFFRIAGLSHGHLQSELLQVPSPFEGLNTKQKGKVSWIKSKHAVNSYHFTFTWSLDPWRINWDRVC